MTHDYMIKKRLEEKNFGTGQTGTNGKTVVRSLGWTFGAGNYNNGGNSDVLNAASGVYVDLATLLPLP
jgi:hypothetical protein